MTDNDLFNLIAVASSIICIVYIFQDTTSRNMSKLNAILGLLGLIGLIIYLLIRKPKAHSQTVTSGKPISEHSSQITDIVIPKFCPHCGSANVRRIRLCEVCGKQIV